MSHFPSVGIAYVHEFDETQDVPAALEETRHVDDALIVGAALDHHVDLDRFQADAVCFLDAFEDLGHRKIDVVHRPEYRIVEGIQADRHAVQSRVLESLRLLFEERPIRGQRQVQTGFLRQHANQLLELAAHQRFAAGDAHFFDAMPVKNFHQPVDLVETQ